jgi:hypothetical protein
MPEALRMADNLRPRIILQQQPRAAGMIDMNMGEQDSVYPGDAHILQHFVQYGISAPGSGIDKNRRPALPVKPGADEPAEPFPGKIKVNEGKILVVYLKSIHNVPAS